MAIGGQLSLFTSLVASSFLLPDALSANDGFSFFGANARTVMPYTIGLLLSALFSVLFALALPKTRDYFPAKLGFQCLALLLLSMTLIQYNLSGSFYGLHTSIGAALFFLEVALAAWMVFKLRWDSINVSSLALMVIAGIASGLYLRPTVGLLLQSQVVFQIFFAVILIRSSQKIKLVL